jgi:MATE family multidrug resistance protein
MAFDTRTKSRLERDMQPLLKIEMKTLMRLAVPIVIGQVTQMLFGLIDTLMIGHVGTTELAAVAFGNSIFVLFLVFSVGIANATAPLVARAVGRADHFGARRILKNSLLLNGCVATLLTLLALTTLFFFNRMGQQPEVARQGQTFFALICLTLVPSMLFQCYKQYLECLNLATVPMVITVIGLALNAGLNSIFIFGLGPIPPLGVAGAALGTIVARFTMLLLIFVFDQNSRKLEQMRTSVAKFEIPERLAVLRDLVKLGVPTGFILLFEVGAFAMTAVFVGWLGVIPLAAHQVTITLASMTFMVPLGLSFAANIRVATEIGRNNWLNAKLAGQAALIITLVFEAFTALWFALGRHSLPALFSKDPDVLRLSATLMVVAAVFQFSDGLQCVCSGLLRALHDVRWPLAITFIAYWIFALPGGYYLTFTLGYGPVGMWWGLCGGLTFSAIFLIWRFWILLKRESVKSISV